MEQVLGELFPHRERLILASRRVSSWCKVVFPAAPSVRCRCEETTRPALQFATALSACPITLLALYARHNA